MHHLVPEMPDDAWDYAADMGGSGSDSVHLEAGVVGKVVGETYWRLVSAVWHREFSRADATNQMTP